MEHCIEMGVSNELAFYMLELLNISLELHAKVLGKYPVGIYLLKVNNGNTRTVCKIC